MTLNDVAKVAGVSPMTVSRVLNGNRALVKGSTFTRVEQAIEDLNYVPNVSARALAGTRTYRVGVVYHTDSPFSFYLDNLVVNAADALMKVGMQLSVVKLTYSSSVPEKIEQLDRMMSDLDGLIVPAPIADHPDMQSYLSELGKPYVLLSGKPSAESAIRVYIDNDSAAQQITEHLVSLGHSRIAFITGADLYDSLEREKGFRRALKLAGHDVDEALIRSGDFSYESGLEAAEQLLKLEHPPTAIFAANDEMALAAIFVANKLNISVPRELSVAGFDGSPLTICATPRLTSVSQQLDVMAKQAVDVLASKLNGADSGSDTARANSSVIIPFKLLLGGSTSVVDEK